MRKYTNYLVVTLMIVFFSLLACKKAEEIIISPTVSNVAKENYVNKVYISILGRKPDVTEYAWGISALEQNNLSLGNRKQLLNIVLNKLEYYQRTYEIASAFFDQPGAIIPSSSEINPDVPAFAKTVYRKFFNRPYE